MEIYLQSRCVYVNTVLYITYGLETDIAQIPDRSVY